MEIVDIKSERDETNKVIRVKLQGNLDLTNFSKIKKYFEALAEGEKGFRCVVDISDVMFIASSIWAVFIARSRVAKLSGGRMILCNMPAEIRGVYNSMNIESILPCGEDYPSCVSVLQSVN